MNRILKIGMDVHSTNYTLCIAEPKLEGEPDYLYEVEVEPDYLNIIKVISNLKKKYKDDALDITCGYEAGCLGYTLCHQLDNVGVKCVIMAPSTMEMPVGRHLKTDKQSCGTPYAVPHCSARFPVNTGFSGHLNKISVSLLSGVFHKAKIKKSLMP